MGLLTKLRNSLTFNGIGDKHKVAGFGITIGTVVDTDDPMQMGRLRIYCPDLNDDPKKVQHLPWAVYASPFGGSIRNSCHAKGHPHPDMKNTSDGVTQYGFWAIPEKGANVLVTWINGDPRKRVWLGCLYEHQEVGGMFHGVTTGVTGMENPMVHYLHQSQTLTGMTLRIKYNRFIII